MKLLSTITDKIITLLLSLIVTIAGLFLLIDFKESHKKLKEIMSKDKKEKLPLTIGDKIITFLFITIVTMIALFPLLGSPIPLGIAGLCLIAAFFVLNITGGKGSRFAIVAIEIIDSPNTKTLDDHEKEKPPLTIWNKIHIALALTIMITVITIGLSPSMDLPTRLAIISLHFSAVLFILVITGKKEKQ